MQRGDQETTVAWQNEGEWVYIYTSVPKHIKKLRAREGVIEVSGEDDWATFKAPRNSFDPMTGFKRRSKPMSPEQRLAAAERLQRAMGAKE